MAAECHPRRCLPGVGV